MARLDAYFLRQTGGFLSKGDGLMGDFYLASVGEFSRAPKILDGGAGTDRVIYCGKTSEYAVTKTADGIQVSGPDGTDLLRGIEAIRFGDSELDASIL